MRKIEQQMCDAIESFFITCKQWQKDNTKVSRLNNGLIEITLFNNVIALINTRESDKFIILKDAGERTKTTKSRLNALLNHFNTGFQIYQKDYQWYVFSAKTQPNFKWTGELGILLLKDK